MGNSLFPSGNASVIGGDGAYGSWTTVFTPSIPLCGFYLAVSTTASGQYGLFNIFIGNGTPGTPQVQNGCMDAGFTGMVYFPFYVGANVAIQLQILNLNSTTDSCSVYVIGVPRGVRKSRSVCQVLGTSTTANFTNLATTPTQLGVSLGLALKEVCVVGGNSSAAISGDFTLSTGSTGATSIISNGSFGGLIGDYRSNGARFNLDLPPSQDIWLTSSVTSTRAMVYLFY